MENDFKRLRSDMVTGQLIGHGIVDQSVIEAMRKVPRHEFVPVDLRLRAYEDGPLAIGQGQTISQPFIVALMTQCLKLGKTKKVLEVGTGSGYQTAVLAEISQSVYTVERIERLSQDAQTILDQLGYKNIYFSVGDGSQGWPDTQSLFDAIILTASVPQEPTHLFQFLTQTGYLVCPVGQKDRQTLIRYKKDQDQIQREEICRCVFVPMIGRYAWPL